MFAGGKEGELLLQSSNMTDNNTVLWGVEVKEVIQCSFLHPYQVSQITGWTQLHLRNSRLLSTFVEYSFCITCPLLRFPAATV